MAGTWLELPGLRLRSPADLTDMIRWCKANGKGLVSATEAFDLNDLMGEAMAYMAAIFAKMESAANSIRVTGAHAFLRKNGRAHRNLY